MNVKNDNSYLGSPAWKTTQLENMTERDVAIIINVLPQQAETDNSVWTRKKKTNITSEIQQSNSNMEPFLISTADLYTKNVEDNLFKLAFLPPKTVSEETQIFLVLDNSNILSLAQNRLNISMKQAEFFCHGKTSMHSIYCCANDPSSIACSFTNWIQSFYRSAFIRVTIAWNLDWGTSPSLEPKTLFSTNK